MSARVVHSAVSRASLVGIVVSLAPALLHAEPVTTLYEITSGTYRAFGGPGLSLEVELPSEYQRFLELTIDADDGSAQMSILDASLERWEEYDPFPHEAHPLPFFDGRIEGNLIVFSGIHESIHGTGTLDYSVSLQPNGVAMSGSLQTFLPGCFDCPALFLVHSDVQARQVPEPATGILLVAGLFAIRRVKRRRSETCP